MSGARRNRGRARRIGLVALLTGMVSAVGLTVPAHADTWQDVINGSLNSTSAFQSAWDYLYPWGSDHNGSARMFQSQVSLSGGVLTLTASRISDNEGNSSSPPYLHIDYHSGAVHAKQQVVVNDTYPNWEVKGEFQAPAETGAWPAFWLTGVDSWPPESDILEFKGNNTNWFNTFRTSSDVSTTRVGVSNPGGWHTYRAWITKVNATDVDIDYYLDGTWKAVHHATGFVGKPMWIIVNLQMEGSSGTPGPGGNTYYRARNIYVGRSDHG